MQQELDAARDYYYVMRELIAHHPGGSNQRTLATVRKLCRAAASIEDCECDAALAAVEEHAAQYFSGGAEASWTRRQLLRELEWFRARLHALEGMARPSIRPPSP